MYDSILCAHDLSPDSDPALRSALDLAATLGSRLTVLFAASPATEVATGEWFPVPPRDLDLFAERMRAAGEAELIRRVEQMQAGRKLPVTLLVESGEAGDAILAAAEKVRADLIVMGTHGRKGWQHLILGSVAERMVRTSPVPVMTVGSAVASARAARAAESHAFAKR